MPKEFNNEKEGSEWVKKYESMQATQRTEFLDLEAYEYIIFHYVSLNEPSKAKLVCEQAMDTFPYASELLLDYAHVLATCGDNKNAMEIVEKAEQFFPYDVDLIVLKCSLMNFEGRHKEAIHYITELEPIVEQKERLYHALANTFAQMENFEDAIFWFKKSLDIIRKF